MAQEAPDLGDVMLICSTTRESPRAVAAAIAAAREDGTLDVCLVLDPAIIRRTRERLLQSGLGEELDEGATVALVTEYRTRGRSCLDEVEHTVRAQGLSCTVRLVEGPFVEKGLEEIASAGAKRLVVSRKRRSQYSRLLFEGLMNELTTAAQLPAEVVDDD